MLHSKSTALVLLLCSALIPATAVGAENNAGPSNNPPASAARTASALATVPAVSNHGHFVCDAAIRADGTVFSGEYVNAAQTSKLGTGTYQVAFKVPCPDVRIALGWFRICQPDTLGMGTLPARDCITADRAGLTNGVWVQIYDANGNLADTPFTLHVSR